MGNAPNQRPIKIRMSTLSERELMMSSLGKLKVAPEKFKKISITEDYTIEERQVIKNKLEEAKNKTSRRWQKPHLESQRKSKKRIATNQVYDKQISRTKSLENDTSMGLKILHTNADQFINKGDLEMFIANDRPDIMLIT